MICKIFIGFWRYPEGGSQKARSSAGERSSKQARPTLLHFPIADHTDEDIRMPSHYMTSPLHALLYATLAFTSYTLLWYMWLDLRFHFNKTLLLFAFPNVLTIYMQSFSMLLLSFFFQSVFLTNLLFGSHFSSSKFLFLSSLFVLFSIFLPHPSSPPIDGIH